VRGASALQRILAEARDPGISVLVVWEPVISSDLGPPISSVLSLVSDRRALQFWDEDRSLSAAMVRSAMADPSLVASGDPVTPDTIVWDFVAIYPPGAIWGSNPRPVYSGGPVVDLLDEVRSRLTTPAP